MKENFWNSLQHSQKQNMSNFVLSDLKRFCLLFFYHNSCVRKTRRVSVLQTNAKVVSRWSWTFYLQYMGHFTLLIQVKLNIYGPHHVKNNFIVQQEEQQIGLYIHFVVSTFVVLSIIPRVFILQWLEFPHAPPFLCFNFCHNSKCAVPHPWSWWVETKRPRTILFVRVN